MKYNFKDITGQKYGRLTAVVCVGSDEKGNAMWVLKCECGKTIQTCGNRVRSGKTKSCGCYRHEMRVQRGRLLGKKRDDNMYGTKFYSTFHLLKQRCNNPKHPRYMSWGGFWV